MDLTPIDPDLKYVKRGYASINKKATKSALAYIFYGSKKATSESDLKNYPVILWLNGGPGASSLIGSLTELGPFYVMNNPAGGYSYEINHNSWVNEYNVLFVD